MDLTVLMKMFEAGALRKAKIVPVPMAEGAWMVVVERQDGVEEYVTVIRQTRQKVYKSLNAAQADLARIGFREATLLVA